MVLLHQCRNLYLNIRFKDHTYFCWFLEDTSYFRILQTANSGDPNMTYLHRFVQFINRGPWRVDTFHER